MKAMVLYDSVFGNTEQIARAIGNALGPGEDVTILRVGAVTQQQLAGLRLLVAGSPTRGFRPTPEMTSFLQGIPAGGLKGIKVASFDTRIGSSDTNFLLRMLVQAGGYAAKPIADALKKAGGDLVAPPEGFFVKDREGPLKEGELERAAEWGKTIGGK